MADAPQTSLDELLSQRRAKLQKLRDDGTNPYPTRFDSTHTADEVRTLAKTAAPPASGTVQGPTAPDAPDAPPQSSRDDGRPKGPTTPDVSVAGRLMTRRDMGKASFAHLQDRSGKVQFYIRKDEVGEAAYTQFTGLMDLGDIVGVTGRPFVTKTGEPSLHAKSLTFLGKALRPPPEKFHGVTDVEIRYRRREVDLFSNEEARGRFYARQKIVSTMRRVLEARGFLEVETPMMQSIPGGATARPFMTHHEALDMDLYMRVAPELFLKRLLVGGLDRVYEIGRAFRNEGIDTRHNPEFTILEAYQAYTNYEGMMDLVEGIIRSAARSLRNAPSPSPLPLTGEGPRSGGEGNMVFEYRGQKVDLAEPFARLSLSDLFQKHAGRDYFELCRTGAWRAAARDLGLDAPDGLPDHKCFELILDEKILPHVPPAAFVFGYPAAFSPLAKQNEEHPEIAERFELFLCGEEVANAYSEQNDPDVQRRHFEAQARAKAAGDEEAMPADEEFLIALEHGMPPAGGLGIGVDRLTMILTGTESIREVILFPLLRPIGS